MTDDASSRFRRAGRALAGSAAWPLQAGFLALSPALDFKASASGLTLQEQWLGRLRLVTVAPENAPADGPQILFCHGGGWFVGGPRAHMGLLRTLARATGWPVTSVDYRLAPRWPIRLAYADCAAALSALRNEKRKLFLMGESAGAAMAWHGACAQPELAGLVLVSPVADLDRRTGPLAARSRLADLGVRLFAPGWFASRAEAQSLSPLHQPLPATFAPTLILTGGADPLRHDARQLRDLLADAGHDVTLISYPRMVHGFFSMGRLTAAASQALADCVAWMQARA